MGKWAAKEGGGVGQLMIEGAREALEHKQGQLRGARTTRGGTAAASGLDLGDCCSWVRRKGGVVWRSEA